MAEVFILVVAEHDEIPDIEGVYATRELARVALARRVSEHKFHPNANPPVHLSNPDYVGDGCWSAEVKRWEVTGG